MRRRACPRLPLLLSFVSCSPRSETEVRGHDDLPSRLVERRQIRNEPISLVEQVLQGHRKAQPAGEIGAGPYGVDVESGILESRRSHERAAVHQRCLRPQAAPAVRIETNANVAQPWLNAREILTRIVVLADRA